MVIGLGLRLGLGCRVRINVMVVGLRLGLILRFSSRFLMSVSTAHFGFGWVHRTLRS